MEHINDAYSYLNPLRYVRVRYIQYFSTKDIKRPFCRSRIKFELNLN